MEHQKHKIVFVNGTFDILHYGHLSLLSYAKSFGNVLKVAIDSDERVRKLKGVDRPINSCYDRVLMLSHLKEVDSVLVFDSNEDLKTIIKNIRPDVMVVGSDYLNKNVIGCEYARRLEFFSRIERYSTTSIIQSIVDR